MGVVPKGRVKRISWYKSHANKWARDPGAIGVTPEQVAALQVMVEEARVAKIEQDRAYSTARSATLGLKLALEKLSLAGSCMVQQIRTQASVSDDPAVYGKAWLPRPRRKSPTGKPGMPTGFKFTMEQTGGLNLSWTCDNPRGAEGTTYHVYRQLDNAGPFAFLGHAGKKKFRDTTLPAGVTMVTYKIQAVRSTAVGDWAEFSVNFGTGAGGAMMASISESSPKLAA